MRKGEEGSEGRRERKRERRRGKGMNVIG